MAELQSKMMITLDVSCVSVTERDERLVLGTLFERLNGGYGHRAASRYFRNMRYWF